MATQNPKGLISLRVSEELRIAFQTRAVELKIPQNALFELMWDNFNDQ